MSGTNSTIVIRNKPLEHYLLLTFSLLLRGEKIIILRSYGSVSGKMIDIVNLLREKILPQTFDVNFKHFTDKIAEGRPGKSHIRVSVLEAHLKVKKHGK